MKMGIMLKNSNGQKYKSVYEIEEKDINWYFERKDDEYENIETKKEI